MLLLRLVLMRLLMMMVIEQWRRIGRIAQRQMGQRVARFWRRRYLMWIRHWHGATHRPNGRKEKVETKIDI